MPSCVLVSAMEKSAHTLETLLSEAGYAPVFTETSAQDARRRMDEEAPALLLADGTGQAIIDLCVDAARATSAAVMLLTRQDAPRAQECGVLVIKTPASKELVRQALRFSHAAHARCAYFQQENRRLERKMEELRLIERAKRALEKTLSMSEAQAHRFIEKQAMDTRQTRVEIAIRILKTYEDTQKNQDT